jgi:hypothetical protein
VLDSRLRGNDGGGVRFSITNTTVTPDLIRGLAAFDVAFRNAKPRLGGRGDEIARSTYPSPLAGEGDSASAERGEGLVRENDNSFIPFTRSRCGASRLSREVKGLAAKLLLPEQSAQHAGDVIQRIAVAVLVDHRRKAGE